MKNLIRPLLRAVRFASLLSLPLLASLASLRADIVGPDGIAYPDWTKAGVPGGIPWVGQKKTIADFGGAAGSNIAPALQAGVDWLKANGGGALLLPAGTYYLDSAVTVTGDNIVIRGAGTSSTVIQFRPSADATDMFKGGITFLGAGVSGSKILLAANGARGATSLQLASGHGLVAGNRIQIECPGAPAGVANSCVQPWFARRNVYQVTAVSGNTVAIDGALRIDFPVAEGAFVKKWSGVSGGGVEWLTFEQTTAAFHSSITFNHTWGCWARNVTVNRTGRFPLYMVNSKHGEIRSCVMNEARNRGTGGTAYVGWDDCYDSLMDSVTTHAMRHAPLLQWSAAGCVVRNSTFNHSDIHFHAGWTHENLIENCTVSSVWGNGGAGFGLLATEPSDVEHGPNGPRNVLYGLDVSSRMTSLFFGGENKDWLILHNRLVAIANSALELRTNSDGHLFENNQVQQRTPNGKPAVELTNTNISGVQVNDSAFRNISASAIVGGVGAAGATQVGNTALSGSGWINVANRQFENGNLSSWDATGDGGMSVVSTAAKNGGSYGLRVTDTSTSAGSSVLSTKYAATAGTEYQVWFDARMVSGSGIAVYLQFYNASNQLLATANNLLPISPDATYWRGHFLQVMAPAGATQVAIWVHSFGSNTCVADFDNFELNSVLVPRPTPVPASIFNWQRGL